MTNHLNLLAIAITGMRQNVRKYFRLKFPPMAPI